MTLPPVLRAVPAVVLLGAAAYGAVALYGMHMRSVGRLQAQVHVLDSTVAVLQQSKRKVDSVFTVKRDTLRLVRHRTDSLLIHTTDTLTRLRIDTVRQIVERERIACDAVLSACAARVATRDSVIAFQGLQIKALGRKGKLFGFLPQPSRTLVFGIGLTGGYLLHR